MKIIISEYQQKVLLESKKIESVQNLVDMAVNDYTEGCSKRKAFRNLELALCKGFKNGTTKLVVLDIKKIHDHYNVKLSIHTDQEWFQRVDFEDFEITLQILVANIIGTHKYGFDIEDMELNDGEGEDMMYEQYEQNLIAENMTEENLRKFCYKVWDKQRKMGEEPHLDDIIYDISGIKKNTPQDFIIIRPIWYRYNGGFNNLFEELSEEVLDKTFRLVVPEINLDTEVKVTYVVEEKGGGYKYDIVVLSIDIDGNGTISYEFLDPETEEQRLVNGSLWDALFEAQEAYETGEFFGSLNYHCYEYFYKLLEKYGIPIDVEVELENLD